ncbi:hypothetical protein LCGC14_0359060, partial [marine sediment metagenome]
RCIASDTSATGNKNFNDVHLSYMFIANCEDEAVDIDNGWGWIIDDVVFEFNDGTYVVQVVGGNSFKIVNSKLIANTNNTAVIHLWSVNNAIIQGNLIRASGTSSAIRLKDAESTIIAANTFDSTVGNEEIFIENDSDFATITGNAFEGSIANAIEWENMDTGGHAISGNTFNTVGSPYTIPILDTGTGSYIKISGNTGLTQTITAAAGGSIYTYGETLIDGTTNNVATTLPDARGVGQRKVVRAVSSVANCASGGGADGCIMTITNGDIGTCEFDAVGESYIGEWDGAKWIKVGGDCT